MDEQTIPFDRLIHPDMEALDKRDAFLSDKNGEILERRFQSLWPDIDEDVEIEVSPLTEDDLDDELRQRIAKELQNDCRPQNMCSDT